MRFIEAVHQVVASGAGVDGVVEKILLHGNVERGVYQRLVAASYAVAPTKTPEAVRLFRTLAQAVLGQEKQLRSRFRMTPTSDDPYTSSGHLFRSLDQQKQAGVRRPELRVFAEPPGEHSAGHPALSNDENVMLRGVHDLMAHYSGRHGFTARGELSAYNRHLKTLPPKTFPIVFTEVVAQVAYFFCYGRFPDQKAVILDDFDPKNVGLLDGSSDLNRFFRFERGALRPIEGFSWKAFSSKHGALARALSRQNGFDPLEWEGYSVSGDASLLHRRADSAVLDTDEGESPDFLVIREKHELPVVCPPEGCRHYARPTYGVVTDFQRKTIESHLKAFGLSRKKIVDIFRESMRQAQEVSGEGKNPDYVQRGVEWYRRANELIQKAARTIGCRPEILAGVIAAISPRNMFEYSKGLKGRNIRGAIVIVRAVMDPKAEMKVPRAYKGVAPGVHRIRDLSPHVIARFLPGISGIRQNVVKAVEVVRARDPLEVLRGSKVMHFYYNLLYPDQDWVSTIDTWIVRDVLGDLNVGKELEKDQDPSRLLKGPRMLKGRSRAEKAKYQKLYRYWIDQGTTPVIEDAIRQVAHEYGLVANQAQAIIWEYLVGTARRRTSRTVKGLGPKVNRG